MFSCQQQQNKESSNNSMGGQIINIDVERLDKVYFKDIFKSINFIPLRSAGNSTIQTINKVKFFNNKYYLLDRRGSAIYIYDTTGNFARKLQLPGNGLAKFENVEDFDINEKTSIIDILTPGAQIYSIDTTGRILSKYKVPNLKASQYIQDLGSDSTLILNIFEAHRVWLYSKNTNKVLKSFLNRPTSLSRNSPMNYSNSPFSSYKGKTNLFEPYSRTVSIVNEDSTSASLTWNFGKSNFDFRTIPSDAAMNYYRSIIESNLVWNFFYTFQTDLKVYTTFIYKRKPRNVIYDKSTKRYQIFEKLDEKYFFPPFNTLYQNNVVLVAEPKNLPYVVSPTWINENNQKNYESSKFNTNPVIIIYKIK